MNFPLAKKMTWFEYALWFHISKRTLNQYSKQWQKKEEKKNKKQGEENKKRKTERGGKKDWYSF